MHYVKCQAEWITSWNQDCQEKYQQPQLCKWYHSHGTKWRGTKEPLDESERGEWKVGLKLNIWKTKIMASSLIISWKREGETVETVADFIFLGSKITADGDCSHEIKRHLLLGRKVMTNLDSILKGRDITLPTKIHLVKAMVFFQWSCMDVRVGLWRKLSTKNRCFWTVVLEKTLQSPLDCKEIQPVHPEGDKSWVFIGRTDVEGEIPILWPPDAKS